MKRGKLLVCLFASAALPLIGGNSCCCPCESKAELMEDFWVSPEQQVQWLQRQSAASGGQTAATEWNRYPATYEHRK